MKPLKHGGTKEVNVLTKGVYEQWNFGKLELFEFQCTAGDVAEMLKNAASESSNNHEQMSTTDLEHNETYLNMFSLDNNT